jgi:hypothetical protein
MQIDSKLCDNVLYSRQNPKIDKDRITRFVDQKLLKLGNKLSNVLLFLGASSNFMTASELNKIPNTLTQKELISNF